MNEIEANELERWINNANQVIVTLKSGKVYLYDGNRQFKFHENSWGYCGSSKTNEDYLYNNYTLSTVEKIELLYKSDFKIIYNKVIMDYFINFY